MGTEGYCGRRRLRSWRGAGTACSSRRLQLSAVPRGSIGRRVARAAATGGSRAYRGRAPLGWYASLVLICVVGVALVGYSRYEANHPVTTTTTTTSTIGPGSTSTWYAALTVDICGKISTLPVSTDTKDSGIISIGSGIIFIHPGAVPNFQDFSGNLATLGQFVIYYKPKMVLTSTELQLPQTGKTPEKLWKNGDLCGSTPGQVQIDAWKTTTAPSPQVVTDPTSLKFSQGQMITVAFLPKGAKIPQASASIQADLQQLVAQATAPTTTTVPVPSTTPASTSTTKPGATTSTTARSTTTTARSSSTTTTTKP
jgi:hypothetical protein